MFALCSRSLSAVKSLKNNNQLQKEMKSWNVRYISLSQRKGIFLLFVLVLVFQGIIFSLHYDNEDPSVFEAYNAPLTEEIQQKIDSLKTAALQQKNELYPFNPNYISDYKGYTLGMSVEEIDRLHEFRKSNKFVNSAREFQEVTKISDRLLAEIAPYFKFPDWVTHPPHQEQAPLPVKDINTATKEDLMAVSGVGEFIAGKILEEREKLGGFVSIDQTAYAYQLSSQTFQNIRRAFVVRQKPHIQKLNINRCSKEDLQKIPYITPHISRQIVIYRSKLDRKLEIEDLEKINSFPLDKIKIITLYLDF